ncbi:large-conductance mechanosensitive channel protein MscL [Proteocatella sphenisci]|uniref:large-conductance mechanosensitive channel protein MscL n=1 Tax=Proteocatella sphenisci TaxID=181070 RepID=UPI000490FB34|nr:large-conductance mechanosensitive channel protein MscL [Proteocatella sphenisci]
MWKEFKDFAFKGNVLDLAVAVVMGGAFGKIVTSLVNDIIMPVVGFFTAGTDFSTLKYVLSQAVMDGETIVTPEAAILYGSFIKNIVDFIIIAFSIFLAIKFINKAKKKKVQEPEKAPEPEPVPQDIKLLEEIRDLLKNNK